MSFSTDHPNPGLEVTEHHTISVVNKPIAQPGKNQVLVHTRACGICGSDVHFWKMGQIGELKVEGKCILGHEACGDIVAVGEDVTRVKVGDRVAVEPQLPCGKCYLCMQGDYNLCQDVEFSSVYPYDGFMQRFKVHSERFVHKIPDKMTYAQGALVEPVSVGYHGIERSAIQLGKPAMVAGAGPIGLCTLALAKAAGATPLLITDISEKRLAFAKEMFPDVMTYQIDTKKTNWENAQAIRALYGEGEYVQPQCTLECTGIESSIVTCGFVTRRAGCLTVIGVGKGDINNFPFMHLSLAEIDVKFINRYHDSWPACINLIANKVIDVDALVTHRFPIEKADEAMAVSSDPSNGNIKVMITDDYEVKN
ncbi:unnamed protein product [[Candida] boidinii]|uniref:Unnamed protein product n=1 Tax=Candida boidinii TaxID=5477 RepID=A0A9W6WHA4_CANBO|nr:hypothetical protein BVG19_g5406 [[Candida] boidinii]OWB48988.1 zinc ion binding protein [[Candida] boidinii]OWB69264.1 zinc ion binding protein [[Candida] boidinii]OWB82702.1 zinc ion binding protein [[Candida] boidinii]GME69453.1 unnamed protein product [[Candida] boidinii]